MSKNIEQKILKLEEDLHQAELRLDAAALDRTYAEDLMVTAPIGVVFDKSAAMDEVRLAASKTRMGTYAKDNLKVRAYGDTAVASYRMTIKAQVEGQEINHLLQITNVWLKRQGQWQVVSRHVANLEQEKQPSCADPGGSSR